MRNDDRRNSVSNAYADIFSNKRNVSNSDSYCKVSGYGLSLEIGKTTKYNDNAGDSRKNETNRNR